MKKNSGVFGFFSIMRIFFLNMGIDSIFFHESLIFIIKMAFYLQFRRDYALVFDLLIYRKIPLWNNSEKWVYNAE